MQIESSQIRGGRAGSAWERAVPRLRLVASPAIFQTIGRESLCKSSRYRFAEAEPPVRVFPGGAGGAWEQGIRRFFPVCVVAGILAFFL
jgi:hypothetical protein